MKTNPVQTERRRSGLAPAPPAPLAPLAEASTLLPLTTSVALALPLGVVAMATGILVRRWDLEDPSGLGWAGMGWDGLGCGWLVIF